LHRAEYKKTKGEGMVSAIAGHGHIRSAHGVPNMPHPRRDTMIPGIPAIHPATSIMPPPVCAAAIARACAGSFSA
jgi:hypothetical protein